MNLDELEELVLSQARSECTLPRAAKAAQLAAIESRCATGPMPDLDLGTAASSGSGAALSGSGAAGSGGWLERLSGVSRAQTLALGLIVGAGGGYGLAQVMAPKPSLTGQAALVPPNTSLSVAKAPLEPEIQEREVQPLQVMEEERPSVVVSQRAPRRAVAKEESRKLSFHEELSYLKRAQKALRSGQAAMALGLMNGLDESHPEGALLVERRMTQVLALCELGRSDEASRLGAQVRESSAGAAYRERLNESCVAGKSAEEKNRRAETDSPRGQHQ